MNDGHPVIFLCIGINEKKKKKTACAFCLFGKETWKYALCVCMGKINRAQARSSFTALYIAFNFTADCVCLAWGGV